MQSASPPVMGVGGSYGILKIIRDGYIPVGTILFFGGAFVFAPSLLIRVLKTRYCAGVALPGAT